MMSEMIRRINAMPKAQVHGNSLAEVSLKMKADGIEFMDATAKMIDEMMRIVGVIPNTNTEAGLYAIALCCRLNQMLIGLQPYA
jgi:methionine aminopeptidase